METEVPPDDPRGRVPEILAVILCSLLIVQCISFALEKGGVFDEVIDIAAGYSYLRSGEYRICPEHPALATTLTAAPLLLLEMDDPRTHPDFGAASRWRFAIKTVHENRPSGGTILFLSRLPSIFLAAVLGWLLFLFGKREFGPAGGLAALFLLATSPTFVAHSALATGDSILTVAAFAAFVTLRRCLEGTTWRRILLAGACLGAALAVKLTAFVLLPVGAILAATTGPGDRGGPFERWTARLPGRARRPGAAAACLLSVFLVALLTVQVIYLGRIFAGPESASAFLHDPDQIGPQGGLAGGLLSAMGWIFPGEYVYGLREMLHSSGEGWPHFLLGEIGRDAPFWAYPLAAAMKTREVVLLGLGVSILGWRLLGLKGTVLLQLLALPVLLILFLGMGSGYHGVRILLPLFPFIFLLVGGAAGRWAEKSGKAWIFLVLGGLTAALPCALAFPHYLAYQNTLAGPGETDYQRLVDSDLDWGQDLPALAKVMKGLGNPRIHLRYFGTDDPRRFGLEFETLSGCDPVKGYVAISATDLQGVYLEDPRCFEWLRDLRPVARAGRSIFIFHVP